VTPGDGAARVAAAFVCAIVLCSCTSGADRQVGVAADRSQAQPIWLPDLSDIEASVEQQLRDGYAALMVQIGRPDLPSAELGSAYGKMGMLFMAAEYYDAAEPCFVNALALAPGDVRWSYYLGHVYRNKHEPAMAVGLLEKSAQLSPDNEAILSWLGALYLELGRPSDAERRFARVLEKQPRSVVALAGVGRAALAQRDFQRAVQRLEEALSLDPEAPGIHYQLALAYRGAGDLKSATRHVQRGGPTQINPPDPLMEEVRGLLLSALAYEARGNRALENAEWVQAASHFRKAIELASPELAPSLRHKLGTSLFLAGDQQEAIQQFEEALRLAPAFARAQLSLGVVMGTAGKLDAAIDYLSAAIKSDPAYVEARLRLAEVLRQAGQPSRALPQYEAILRIDPRIVQTRLDYALTLAEAKRYQDATNLLIESAKLYPDHPEFGDALAHVQKSADSPTTTKRTGDR
jgi:tetratricopeptide (TPR) repeat protein